MHLLRALLYFSLFFFFRETGTSSNLSARYSVEFIVRTPSSYKRKRMSDSAIFFHYFNAFYLQVLQSNYTPYGSTTLQKRNKTRNRLLELLLGAELVGVTALPLTAVGGTRGEASLALHHVSTTRLNSATEGERRWLVVDSLRSIEETQGPNIHSTCGRWTFRSCTWRPGPSEKAQ